MRVTAAYCLYSGSGIPPGCLGLDWSVHVTAAYLLLAVHERLEVADYRRPEVLHPLLLKPSQLNPDVLRDGLEVLLTLVHLV